MHFPNLHLIFDLSKSDLSMLFLLVAQVTASFRLLKIMFLCLFSEIPLKNLLKKQRFKKLLRTLLLFDNQMLFYCFQYTLLY